MKLVVSIIFALTALFCRAQDSAVDSCKRLFGPNDLALLDACALETVTGKFCRGNGFYVQTYELDSSGKFEHREMDCMSDFLRGKGYRVVKDGTLIMSRKFVVYRFEKSYFLIPVSEQVKFKKEFQTVALEVYNLSRKMKSDDAITDVALISFIMAKQFFTRIY